MGKVKKDRVQPSPVLIYYPPSMTGVAPAPRIPLNFASAIPAMSTYRKTAHKPRRCWRGFAGKSAVSKGTLPEIVPSPVSGKAAHCRNSRRMKARRHLPGIKARRAVIAAPARDSRSGEGVGAAGRLRQLPRRARVHGPRIQAADANGLCKWCAGTVGWRSRWRRAHGRGRRMGSCAVPKSGMWRVNLDGNTATIRMAISAVAARG
jgi:hypothetical protein